MGKEGWGLCVAGAGGVGQSPQTREMANSPTGDLASIITTHVPSLYKAWQGKAWKYRPFSSSEVPYGMGAIRKLVSAWESWEHTYKNKRN